MDKRIIIFDLDGTIFDTFLERDRVNIRRIFMRNVTVIFIDSILRIINSFDMIKNSMPVLKIRLFLYSFFVNKSYKKIYEEYSKWYIKESRDAIVSHMQELKFLEDYEVIILSNNLFSKELDIDSSSFLCNFKIVTEKSKYRYLKKLKKAGKNIVFMIGNNFADDIWPALVLDIWCIYIGKNQLIRNMADYSAKNMLEVIKILKKQLEV